jgi:hypothetical protein
MFRVSSRACKWFGRLFEVSKRNRVNYKGKVVGLSLFTPSRAIISVMNNTLRAMTLV